jgi:hypothetical protein
LIPIECGANRVDLIAENRIQWFAEARHRHAPGATWWEFPSAITQAQEDRQQVDPWEDHLRDMIANGRASSSDGLYREPWPEGWISSAEIMRNWLRLEPHQQGRASSTRLVNVMRRLGYLPASQGKAGQRGWIADTQEPSNEPVSAEVSAQSLL